MQSKKVFFIGIGGIGMSAIARYFLHKGHSVFGSDGNSSELIESLVKEGVNFFGSHNRENITSDIDLIIYTVAISDDNEEFVRAKELGIKCLTYAQALGEITKEKTTIAICGTHGKTTTTAMTYYALKECGINPTVIVGSILPEFNSNFVFGDSEYLIVEACEYKRSFLNLFPEYILVTNIDEDHLDYYKDFDDIKSAFQEFVNNLTDKGEVILHREEFNLINTKNKILADAYLVENLSVLGEHNRKNAQLVVALGNVLGLNGVKIKEGLKNFKGTWRRMEYKGKTKNGVEVFDDYGHHPVEINATINAIKEKYFDKKIFVIFQPHLFSRTKIFLDDFAQVLSNVSKVFVLPIYAAREKDNGVVKREDLINKINDFSGNATSIEKEEIVSLVENINYDVIFVNIGAGDAYQYINKVSFGSNP